MKHGQLDFAMKRRFTNSVVVTHQYHGHGRRRARRNSGQASKLASGVFGGTLVSVASFGMLQQRRWNDRPSQPGEREEDATRRNGDAAAAGRSDERAKYPSTAGTDIYLFYLTSPLVSKDQFLACHALHAKSIDRGSRAVQLFCLFHAWQCKRQTLLKPEEIRGGTVCSSCTHVFAPSSGGAMIV